jgi:hypothetical protein
VFWGVSYQASGFSKSGRMLNFEDLQIGLLIGTWQVEGAIFVAGILVLGFFWWIPVSVVIVF